MPLSDRDRKQIHQLIDEAGGEKNPSGWFEPLYQQARGDSAEVPWANMGPNPLLTDWLEAQPAVQDSPLALVIGCGLGDDAEALAQVGYQVTAFDISDTAIAWAKQRFPTSFVTYEVGDIFHPKPEWHQRFDFVFECRNFQALPVSVRETGMRSIAKCVAQNGRFLMITNYRGDAELTGGPPWALGAAEFLCFAQEGLQEVKRETISAVDPNLFPKLRIEFRRF